MEAEGTRDPEWAIHRMKCLLDVGAKMIRAESEGITENVKSWRSHVNARFVIAIGLDHLMFEVADLRSLPDINNYGPVANLFVDHSQIVQLECLRSGIWGTKGTLGRILTYQD
ncbi:MAG TPA: phosphosulfolactate synthase [Nitrospiraceae bacterium]|nr:phosphosulfolactate synthase [Nitrospiraceae bacterium]